MVANIGLKVDRLADVKPQSPSSWGVRYQKAIHFWPTKGVPQKQILFQKYWKINGPNMATLKRAKRVCPYMAWKPYLDIWMEKALKTV